MSKILGHNNPKDQLFNKVTMRRVVDTSEFAKVMDFTKRIKTPAKDVSSYLQKHTGTIHTNDSTTLDMSSDYKQQTSLNLTKI